MVGVSLCRVACKLDTWRKYERNGLLYKRDQRSNGHLQGGLLCGIFQLLSHGRSAERGRRAMLGRGGLGSRLCDCRWLGVRWRNSLRLHTLCSLFLQPFIHLIIDDIGFPNPLTHRRIRIIVRLQLSQQMLDICEKLGKRSLIDFKCVMGDLVAQNVGSTDFRNIPGAQASLNALTQFFEPRSDSPDLSKLLLEPSASINDQTDRFDCAIHHVSSWAITG